MGFADATIISLRNNRHLQRTPTRDYWIDDRFPGRLSSSSRPPIDMVHRSRLARREARIKLIVALMLVLMVMFLIFVAF